VNIVEGTDEPGQRHIPLEQPHECKDERADGEENGEHRRESRTVSRESRERHESRSIRLATNNMSRMLKKSVRQGRSE
jgi:hypothetical protein